ncbi:MAG: sortase [Clostridia bacterium]|nr:sortase [Clostridia bacterium]
MFESKYNKLLTIILVVVVVAVIGLLGFLAFNYFQESNSTQEAAQFVDNYQGDDLTPDSGDSSNNKKEDSNGGDSDPLAEMAGNSSSGNGNSATIKKKTTYKGYVVDGTMKIPKISFSYPVLEKVSKSAIENSVAILYGAGLNQVGNTVIIGHNYRNGQFFSNNKKLSNGDKIYITDYEGGQKSYVIYNKFETTPEDTSFYQRDTNGKAEITLSTCTDDSKARLIIFAKEEG